MVTTTRSTIRCTMYIVAGMRWLCTQIVNVLKNSARITLLYVCNTEHINRFSSHHYHHEGQTQSPKSAFCKYFKTLRVLTARLDKRVLLKHLFRLLRSFTVSVLIFNAHSNNCCQYRIPLRQTLHDIYWQTPSCPGPASTISSVQAATQVSVTVRDSAQSFPTGE